MLAALPLILVLAWVLRPAGWSWHMIIAGIAVTASWAAVAAFPVAAIVWENVADGCFFAPATVEYHDGMTLCPGQSTTIRIEVPLDGPAAPRPLHLR